MERYEKVGVLAPQASALQLAGAVPLAVSRPGLGAMLPGVPLGEGDGLGLGDGLGVGLGVGEGVGLALGDGLGLPLGVGEGVPATVAKE